MKTNGTLRESNNKEGYNKVEEKEKEKGEEDKVKEEEEEEIERRGKLKESERDGRSEFMLQARGSCCEREILLPVRAQLPGSHT